jgi:hypothetical protein
MGATKDKRNVRDIQKPIKGAGAVEPLEASKTLSSY